MKKQSAVKIISVLLSVCLLFIVMSSAFSGEKASKPNKAVFDVRIKSPQSAALHLKLIHETFKGREYIIIFSGPAVKLISNNREGFSEEENILLDEISSKISQMTEEGIRLEVCLVAAKVFNVDPASLLTEIKQVENGWLSIVDYQANGYYLVPAY
jgi:intracellular sulfur oxidation DsrE/DsrF family protein